MRRRVLLLIVILVCTRTLVSAGEEPVVNVVPAQPLEILDPLEPETRVWVRQGISAPEGGLLLLIRYAETFPASQPAMFECEIHAEVNAADSVVALEIIDRDGEIVAAGEAKLDLVKGINRCNFAWDPSAMGDGAYTAHFYIWHPMRGRRSYSELELTKISPSLLQREIDAARDAVGGITRHLAPFLQSSQPSIIGIRHALAQDYLRVAEAYAVRGTWPRALHVAGFVQSTVHSIRAYLTFAPEIEELLRPISQPDMAQLRIRNGTFYAGDQPVFLFGWNRLLTSPTEFEHLQRYALNSAVLTVPPDTALSRPNLGHDFDTVFADATQHNVALTVLAPVGTAAAWTPEVMPGIIEPLQPVEFIAAHRAAERQRIEQYLSVLLPPLMNRRHLLSLSLADKPAFHMQGPETAAAFADYIRGRYRDRLSVNRAWRTRFSDFSEIDVWWENPSTAYQYDWQSFQYLLGYRFFDHLARLARTHLPGVPLQIQYADNMFVFGETRLGVDHEALANLTDISGCAVATHANDPAYALRYPETAIVYAFLRSLAPDQPIYNSQQRLWSDIDPDVDYSFDYVHSAMWDGAIEGQDASALLHALPPTPPDFDQKIYEHPETFEGYVTAALHINRLADIVAAFQAAPADVAVLMSLPSRILNDGVPYVTSLVAAFEGASLTGRKVDFITEEQIRQGRLESALVLIIPNMTAISESAFEAVNVYIQRGGVVIRAGTVLPYDVWGHSRRDIVSRSLDTIYLTESAQAAQFYHAMDAADTKPSVPRIPHIVNNFNYPLEGVKSRFILIDDVPYLYVLNLRKQSEMSYLIGQYRRGRDLIRARDVQFPTMIQPLDPMLIRLEPMSPDDEPESNQRLAPEPAADVPQPVPTTPDGTPIIPVAPVTPLLPADTVR